MLVPTYPQEKDVSSSAALVSSLLCFGSCYFLVIERRAALRNTTWVMGKLSRGQISLSWVGSCTPTFFLPLCRRSLVVVSLACFCHQAAWGVKPALAPWGAFARLQNGLLQTLFTASSSDATGYISGVSESLLVNPWLLPASFPSPTVYHRAPGKVRNKIPAAVKLGWGPEGWCKARHSSALPLAPSPIRSPCLKDAHSTKALCQL